MKMMGIAIKNLTKIFSSEKKPALDALTCLFPEGKITGIVGPDGAGKTTLLRLIVGLLAPNQGTIEVLGVNSFSDKKKLYQVIGYMPQRFGLYEDLTVWQNIHLYSELQGAIQNENEADKLLELTQLSSFKSHLTGKLSGGMKQKLALICALLKKPKALILDEPSVGVDPLSRRELWEIIETLKKRGITIIWSTSYLDEAEKCDHVLLLNKGKSLYEGPPQKLIDKYKERSFLINGEKGEKRVIFEKVIQDDQVLDATIQGNFIRIVIKDPKKVPYKGYFSSMKKVKPSLEDAFIILLGGAHKPKHIQLTKNSSFSKSEETVISVQHLTKKFKNFTAVNDVSFDVKKGEIFGLIGPNGAGKSTTFKILLGLLSPTEGDAFISGISMQKSSSQARGKIGYMAQKFSLYNNMTVGQNLRFFSGVYPIKKSERKQTVEKMIALFEIEKYLNHLTSDLPFGIKQRLALSCSLIHSPEVLFLDEPTSGVDPITRREFWHHINSLSEQGVTILVTTHYMEEAEYCDRIGLLHHGKLRALGSPDELKAKITSPNPTLEEAFIQLCSKKERL